MCSAHVIPDCLVFSCPLKPVHSSFNLSQSKPFAWPSGKPCLETKSQSPSVTISISFSQAGFWSRCTLLGADCVILTDIWTAEKIKSENIQNASKRRNACLGTAKSYACHGPSTLATNTWLQLLPLDFCQCANQKHITNIDSIQIQ